MSYVFHYRKQLTAYLVLLVISMAILSCGSAVQNLSSLSARELFLKGKEKYDRKKYINAIEYFQTVVYNYPGDAIVDTAQYYLAMSYYHNRDYELATVEFNRLATNYPSSAYFEKAIFMKAVSFFEATPQHYGLDQSDLKKAFKLFEDFIIDFPESELLGQAQEYLLAGRTRMAHKYYSSGILYSRISAYKAAKIYFQLVIDEYTDTKYAKLATFQYALMEYKSKNYAEARKKFESFIAVFPDDEKLVKKAREKIVDAAFHSCQQMYKKGKMTDARQCWEEFTRDFPDNKKVKKAVSYIKKIDKLNQKQNTQEHAGT